MTPEQITNITKQLKYNNLNREVKRVYTQAKWESMTDRDRAAIYLGFAQGTVATVEALTPKAKSDPLVGLLSMMMMSMMIKELQEYHDMLCSSDTSHESFKVDISSVTPHINN